MTVVPARSAAQSCNARPEATGPLPHNDAVEGLLMPTPEDRDQIVEALDRLTKGIATIVAILICTLASVHTYRYYAGRVSEPALVTAERMPDSGRPLRVAQAAALPAPRPAARARPGALAPRAAASTPANAPMRSVHQ